MIAIVLTGASAGAVPCAVELGEPRFAFARAAPSSILGSGPYSTTWLDSDGRNARKHYRHRHRLDNDVAAFALFRWIAVGHPTFFRIPRVAGVRSAPPPHEAMMVVPYVPGRTVLDLLDDATVDAAVKVEIERAYADALDVLAAHPLGRSFRTRSRRLDARAILGAPVFGVKLLLKPDNVMVDPWTLRLTLIDPY